MKKSIKLTAHEIQSNSSRVKFAEGLILQLSANHEGRNTWLLNYGSGEEAQAFQNKRENMSWDHETESLANNPNIEQEKVDSGPTKILLKNPINKYIAEMDDEVGRVQKERHFLLAGYLAALGYEDLENFKIEISPDYTFLTLTKKEEKDNGSKREN